MKQYASLLQRILSIAIVIGLGVVLALVGFVFLWYLLVFGLVVFIARKVFFFFKGKSCQRDSAQTPFEAGHVETGDFSRSRGRIIEHGDDPTGINS